MIDGGDNDHVTLEDVKRRAADGTLIDYLTKLGGGTFASGFLKGKPQFSAWYVEKIADNCMAMNGREGKYGIRNRGLCLLFSYTAEIMQQGDDLKFNDPVPTIRL